MSKAPFHAIPLPRARLELGVSERTARRYLQRGLLQGFQLPGGHWRIYVESINRLRAGSYKLDRG